MNRIVTGWLLLAGCLALLGLGAFASAWTTRATEVPQATMRDWRRYAADVERGARTPSPATTRMLTETAISQHESARASRDLLRFLGIATTILSMLLVVDLVRHRARVSSLHPSREAP